MGHGGDRSAGPAPLFSIAEAPVPADAEAHWLQGAGGVRLRTALFPALVEPRGSVVINPGRTEFIEKYLEVVGELRARGLAVLVHDWRGQGLSDRLTPDPLLGHARSLQDFLDDHDRVLSAYAERLPRPWISLAHSMGGGLTAVGAARGERRYAAMVHSAPMFGLQSPSVPRAVADATISAQMLWGGAKRLAVHIEPGGGPYAKLSHDAARWDRWRRQITEHPELSLGGLTWGWLQMATDVRRALGPRALAAVDVPTLFALAGAEAITDNAAVKRAAAAMPSAEVLEIPGSWHEVMMETDAVRAAFWSAFDGFVERVAPRSASAAAEAVAPPTSGV